MLSELKTAKKVVGVKQLKKALMNGTACRVFLAEDADPLLTEPLRAMSEERGIPVVDTVTMEALSTACGISVRAAAAAILS